MRPRESTSTLPRLPAGSSPMVAGRPLAVFGGRGVSLPPPQAATVKAASGTLAAVATMRRHAQREFIGPMLTGPRPRSRQHSDRPTRERDRRPSPGRTRGPGGAACSSPMSEAAADSLRAYVSAPARAERERQPGERPGVAGEVEIAAPSTSRSGSRSQRPTIRRQWRRPSRRGGRGDPTARRISRTPRGDGGTVGRAGRPAFLTRALGLAARSSGARATRRRRAGPASPRLSCRGWAPRDESPRRCCDHVPAQ